MNQRRRQIIYNLTIALPFIVIALLGIFFFPNPVTKYWLLIILLGISLGAIGLGLIKQPRVDQMNQHQTEDWTTVNWTIPTDPLFQDRLRGNRWRHGGGYWLRDDHWTDGEF
ncbi:MAG: hypothetical protein WC073_15810 [Sterolibacterium sp.]